MIPKVILESDLKIHIFLATVETAAASRFKDLAQLILCVPFYAKRFFYLAIAALFMVIIVIVSYYFSSFLKMCLNIFFVQNQKQ